MPSVVRRQCHQIGGLSLMLYSRNEYHTSNAAHYNGITDGDKNEGPLNIKVGMS